MYPGGENERYLEVWNLVLVNLTIIKTTLIHHYQIKILIQVWGLKRMASVSQNVRTNYETDLFMPIINEVEK